MEFDEPVSGQDAGASPSLPDQHDFYKMPAKFGHVPVAEEPLGWDPAFRAPIPVRAATGPGCRAFRVREPGA